MNGIPNIEQTVIDYLEKRRQHHALRRAIRRAFDRMAKQHPQWVELLFDEHFLFHHALPLLNSALTARQLPKAGALVEAWAAQMPHLMRSRKRYIASAVPVARTFLKKLGQELESDFFPAISVVAEVAQPTGKH